MSRRQGAIVLALAVLGTGWAAEAARGQEAEAARGQEAEAARGQEANAVRGQEASEQELAAWLSNPENTKPYQKLLSDQFAAWLKSDGAKRYGSQLPSGFNLQAGTLEFPAAGQVTWTFARPQNLAGSDLATTKATLAKILQAYLNPDPNGELGGLGGQALDPVPEKFREPLLKNLMTHVQISIAVPQVQQPDPPPVPPTPPIQPAKSWPLASAQSSQAPLASAQSSQVPAASGPVVYTPTVFTSETPESQMNRGFAAYWSGDTISAAQAFRGATVSSPDDAIAWYFLALSQVSMGDQIGANASLRQAAAVEAREHASHEVSFSLVRVQGPVRYWIEEARRRGESEQVQR